MPYQVLNKFNDKDTSKLYNQGDLYEHEDATRVAFLVERGYLNKEAIEKEFPKHTGGGWYLLSNGEKIQGKEEAAAAETELESK